MRNELIRLQNLGILKRFLKDKHNPENLKTYPSKMIEKLWQTVKVAHVDQVVNCIIDSYASMVEHIGLIEYRHVEPLKKDLSSRQFRDELIINMSPYMQFLLENKLFQLFFTTARYSTQICDLQNMQQLIQLLALIWRVSLEL